MLRIIFLAASLFFTPDWVQASNNAVYPPGHAKAKQPLATKPGKAPEKMVRRAHELIGTKYRWGGSSVSTGFDCSGLLVYLHHSVAGIRIPRTTTSMLQSRAPNIAKHQLKPGDAVFFKHNGRRAMNHVGIYIGKGRFIHAPSTGKHIRIDSLKNRYWAKSYVVAKRFHRH